MNGELKISAQRVIKPHTKDCFAVDSKTLTNPWGVIINRSFFGSWYGTIYNKKCNNYYWHVVTCNDPKCKAELAIRF